MRRLTIKKDGKSIQTGTYFLTFDRPTPPEKLAVGYLKVDVSLYIPNPLRYLTARSLIMARTTAEAVNAVSGVARTVMTALTVNSLKNVLTVRGTIWPHRGIVLCGRKKKKLLPSKPKERSAFQRPGSWTSPSPTSRTYAAAVKPSTRTSACQTELVWVCRYKPVTYTAPPSGPVAAQSKTTCSQSQTVTVSALPQVGPSTEQPSCSQTPNSQLAHPSNSNSN